MIHGTGKRTLPAILLLQALLLVVHTSGRIHSRELTKEVYQAAKRGFEVYIGICEDGGGAFFSVCSDTTVDIESLYLCDEPLKVSVIPDSSMAGCGSGSDLIEAAVFREYWFFVLSGGSAVGTVGTTCLSGEWKYGSISRGGREIFEMVDFLEKRYPRSAGSRFDLLSLGWRGEWFLMVSSPEIGHLIAPVDSRFSLVYGIPKAEDGGPNIVPLATALQKMKDEAAKRVEWARKNPDSFR